MSERQLEVSEGTLRSDRDRDLNEAIPIDSFSRDFEVEPGDELALVLEVVSSTGMAKEALVALRFEDPEGGQVENPGWGPKSDVVGDFQYLETSAVDRSIVQTIRITVPDGASTLKVKGVQWKKQGETTLVADPVLVRQNSEYSATVTPSGVLLENSSATFRQRERVPQSAVRVKLEVNVLAGDEIGKAPLQLVFEDVEGSEVPGFGDLPQHPRFGSFLQLEPESGEAKVQTFEAVVPAKAKFLELRGIDWGAKSARILGPVRVLEIDEQDAVVDLIGGTLDDFDSLIVLDTTAPPLGHGTLALRPNNLARVYSGLGSAVVFFPFGSLQGFPQRAGSGLVQFDRSRFDDVCAELMSLDFDGPKVYICSSFPSLSSCAAAERLKAAGWTVVYECRDDMEEFNRVGYSKWYNVQLERQMLQIADQVVSVSPALDQKLASLDVNISNNLVIPNGVNESVIAEGEDLRTEEVLTSRNSSRTLGYVGHLTESWFDWPLLLGAADEMPDVTFEIVGHGMPSNLTLPSNVKYLGPKTHTELRHIVGRWKGGLIPFADLPLTRSVDPNKIYEYQAWGLRTLSAPMGSVEQYPSTWVYRNFEEFVAGAREILQTPLTALEVKEIESFVEGCTWLNRGKSMRAVMGLAGGAK